MPSTQQAEKAGLTDMAESEACQSIFPETDKGPYSSVFTAMKPIKMTYSYNKLSVGNLSIIREL
jgi:hypothetical protein